MNVTYEDLKLPPIYKKNGKDCYLDPIRKKLITISPEETVRQKVLSYIITELKVPLHAIMVEQHLSHYGINSRRRADIVIEALTRDKNNILPLAVIECKAPNVPLDEKAMKQMLAYCDEIGAIYAMLVNQHDFLCFKYIDEKGYIPITEFPQYKQMLEGKYVEFDVGTVPERIPFDKLESYLKEEFQEEINNPGYIFPDISSQTEIKKGVMAFNLLEGLLDVRKKFPIGNYGAFSVIEDYGVRMLSYGNASGGRYFAPYRSFILDVNGNIEIVSFSVTTSSRNGTPDKIKTSLCVAIDNEKESHHALQLVIDENVTCSGNCFKFYHHGKIAIGNKGSGKIEELRLFVEKKYPELICQERFYLGSIKNDRLFYLDDSEIVSLLVNLIKYALVRDEYRAYVKQTK